MRGSPGPHLHSSDGDGGTRALGESGHGLGGTAGWSDVVHRHVHLDKTDGHRGQSRPARGLPVPAPPHPPPAPNPCCQPASPYTSPCPDKGAVCQPAAGTEGAASQATSDTPACEPGPGTLNQEPPKEDKLPPRVPGTGTRAAGCTPAPARRPCELPACRRAAAGSLSGAASPDASWFTGNCILASGRRAQLYLQVDESTAPR